MLDYDSNSEWAQHFGYLSIIIGGKLFGTHNARHLSQIFAKLIGRIVQCFVSAGHLFDHISGQLAAWPNCC